MSDCVEVLNFDLCLKVDEKRFFKVGMLLAITKLDSLIPV